MFFLFAWCISNPARESAGECAARAGDCAAGAGGRQARVGMGTREHGMGTREHGVARWRTVLVCSGKQRRVLGLELEPDAFLARGFPRGQGRCELLVELACGPGQRLRAP